MNRLKDKVAVITGGAQGIGFATAEVFRKEGASVIIWDVNADRGSQAVKNLESIEPSDKAQRVLFTAVNVADSESVARATQQAINLCGRIDILINNAGITRDATMKKMSDEQWQSVIDVNLTGVFNCTRAVSPIMVDNGWGRIISTSSVVALYGNFGQSNYVAAKAGIIGMTKTWAREFGRKGITVNAVAPGFIATEMIETVPEKVLDMMKSKTPLARLGEPADIANAYLYLASDEASFVTGTVLSVDGGLTL